MEVGIVSKIARSSIKVSSTSKYSIKRRNQSCTKNNNNVESCNNVLSESVLEESIASESNLFGFNNSVQAAVNPLSSSVNSALNIRRDDSRLWRASSNNLMIGSSKLSIERNNLRKFSSSSFKPLQGMDTIEVGSSSGLPPPLNEVQVPLISPNLRSQIFPLNSSIYAPSLPSKESIKISLEHLQSHGLATTDSKKSDKIPNPAIDFDLPMLHGPTISHHFHALGQESASPYLELAKELAEPNNDLPPMPKQDQWVLQPGWTFYSPDGSFESVKWPREDEKALVFDVETLPFQGGHFPIMAVAAGIKGWYAWFSPWITGDDKDPNHLIPFSESPSSSAAKSSTSTSASTTSNTNSEDNLSLFEKEDSKPRLLIGHNVLFDRARVSSEYTLRRPNTRWLDTLSLHVAVSGITNPQRPVWIKDRKNKTLAEEARELELKLELDETEVPITTTTTGTKVKKIVQTTPPDGASKRWQDLSSPNSLVEVARLHIGTEVDKSTRNIFIDPAVTPEEVREHFDQLINYCANDVLITYQVYKVLLPKFLNLCPHPASFSGILLMSQPVLPVDRKWPQYLERAESTYRERSESVKKSLEILAEEARGLFEKVDKDGKFVWENDIWLKQLDWSPKKARRILSASSKKKLSVPVIESPSPVVTSSTLASLATSPVQPTVISLPAWYSTLAKQSTKSTSNVEIPTQSPLAALLFQTSWRSYPSIFTHSHGWLFSVPTTKRSFKPSPKEELILQSELGNRDNLVKSLKGIKLYSIPAGGKGRCLKLLGWTAMKWLSDGSMTSPYKEMNEAVLLGKDTEGKVFNSVNKKLLSLANKAKNLSKDEWEMDPWLNQLDWTPISESVSTSTSVESPVIVDSIPLASTSSTPSTISTPTAITSNELVWPKWYWDLDDVPTKGLDMSIGKRAAPLLLKLRWKGYPIVYSVAHGWIYRVPLEDIDSVMMKDQSLVELSFGSKAGDMGLFEDKEASYFKLPHPDGEDKDGIGKNVGSPLSRSFVSAFEDKVLTSEYSAAADALAMNASCSYWTSSRERIINQMVIWEGNPKTPTPTSEAIKLNQVSNSTQGLILPQVVPMGTVTRRSVEKTWLTASNAKKNRVGSELKSMVQAPPGYAIVGADVDSEELWICSVMGDAQFGLHGATAIGWMGLEGTKSAGTDLHSKTAKILGISRDDAKVFNYSRIYGAGVKHAVQLLLKSNPALAKDDATKSANELYASTKGLVDRSATFNRTFWHGGTESFVFNKLEQIAHSDTPTTPALGCGITDALKKANLPAEGRQKAGTGFMPSRINWVVQSSGVDYLHLLLVSMEYLCKRFKIDARYMISVHDEVRYIVKDEDKFRAAMALQISNIWTRSLFSYRLQLDSLPESCAFFSAVDIDHCFRKEVNMNCLTPSNPDPIPFGISYDITDSLKSTSNGSLFSDGTSMKLESQLLPSLPFPNNLSDIEIKGERHRVDTTDFLVVQTKSSPAEVKKVWNLLIRKKEEEENSSSRSRRVKKDFSTRNPIKLSSSSTTRSKPISSSFDYHDSSNVTWDDIVAATKQDSTSRPPTIRKLPTKRTSIPRTRSVSSTLAKSSAIAPSIVPRRISISSIQLDDEAIKQDLIIRSQPRIKVSIRSRPEIIEEEEWNPSWSDDDDDNDREIDETAAATFRTTV